MNKKRLKRELPNDVRSRSIALINRQLANTLDLRIRAKQVSWNLRASRLGSLQKLIIQVLRENRSASETLAERVKELGGVVEATIQGIRSNSRLKLYPISPTGAPDRLWAFCGTFAHYTAALREAAKTSDLSGDYDTGDLITLISRTADRLL